jgi:hypothetical protein
VCNKEAREKQDMGPYPSGETKEESEQRRYYAIKGNGAKTEKELGTNPR